MDLLKRIKKEIATLKEIEQDLIDAEYLLNVKGRKKSAYLSFWNDIESDDEPVCEISLNKKETELVRRFVSAMKTRRYRK